MTARETDRGVCRHGSREGARDITAWEQMLPWKQMQPKGGTLQSCYGFTLAPSSSVALGGREASV